jgi:hypothetical protein
MEFTRNIVSKPELRGCSRVFYLIRDTPFHIQGCTHHMKQLLKDERERGDDTTFYLFHASLGTFCQVCWQFDNERPVRGPFSQAVLEIYESTKVID